MKCFKCNKKIKHDKHHISNAVRFTGGNEYGSTIYDSMVDGIIVEIIICDKCLKDYKILLHEINCQRKIKI